MPQEERSGANTHSPDAGPFLAKVVSHLDPAYMGALEVQLIHESGNDEDREGQLRVVKHLNPFYGTTSMEFVGDSPDTHDQTQKAYGMWFVPPDVGTIVACIFIGGDTRKGYWFGCVQDEDMNFEVPGYAATSYVVDDSRTTDKEKERVPVSEYNKIIHPEVQSDTTKKLKPEHPFAKILEDQGLLKDDIRGITTSSGRREVPSSVFGISTPGPVDKAGKQGKVGKHEHKVAAAFVSRLGGSSFVMDDGDDKWERKTLPSEGPPEYVSVEDGETALRDRPHNELIRLRTRTGHQILLHNSEDLIYIGNSRGTTWIELTSDGKIDIFAEDSISIRTKQDFNFYADRDINMEAGRNFNVKVKGEKHTHVIGDQILIVDGNQKIHVKQDVDETFEQNFKQHVKQNVDKLYDQNYKQTNLGNFDLKTTGGNKFTAGSNTDIKSGGNHIETASQIHMNGPSAATAAQSAEAGLPQRLKLHTIVDLPAQDEWQSLTSTESIVRRIPTPEPYPHHENLDPVSFKPGETDRDKAGRYESTDGEELNTQQDFTSDFNGAPEKWRQYSTATDTFRKGS